MKLWKIVTKRQAEEDAVAIWRLIAEDHPQAAEAFLDAIVRYEDVFHGFHGRFLR